MQLEGEAIRLQQANLLPRWDSLTIDLLAPMFSFREECWCRHHWNNSVLCSSLNSRPSNPDRPLLLLLAKLSPSEEMLCLLSGGSRLVVLSGGSWLFDYLAQPTCFVQFAVCNCQLCCMTNTKMRNKETRSWTICSPKPCLVGHLDLFRPWLQSSR